MGRSNEHGRSGERPIRWGIIATGGIARGFATELRDIEGAVMQAAASRSAERAEAFAAEFGVERAYGSYEELAADPDVDIVYVASPHSHHHEHTMLCLDSGKAVLCEKAFAMSAGEARDMVEAARARKLFLMEAMWTRYLPAIRRVREWIAAGEIGEVKMVKADFGFRFPWDPEHRLLKKELGGGALLDAGIYTSSFASMIFGEQPKRIESTAHLGSLEVDEWLAALFDYGDGRIAVIANALRLPMRTEAFIFGTEGRIELPFFLGAKSAKLVRTDDSEIEFTDTQAARGMHHEAEEAMRCIRAGERESPLMPLDETVAIMETLDTMRGQWGLAYGGE